MQSSIICYTQKIILINHRNTHHTKNWQHVPILDTCYQSIFLITLEKGQNYCLKCTKKSWQSYQKRNFKKKRGSVIQQTVKITRKQLLKNQGYFMLNIIVNCTHHSQIRVTSTNPLFQCTYYQLIITSYQKAKGYQQIYNTQPVIYIQLFHGFQNLSINKNIFNCEIINQHQQGKVFTQKYFSVPSSEQPQKSNVRILQRLHQ
eukprot:TRINITY_DN8810_c0_g1_i1.p2 TRINITY_DN8810_c0_g1~~TRINITY_DN8810_c0_g1_i1.p2  ORF type:complete len:203 (-),score=-22.97 TRINITY_DN8810_c0_g1_i1:334-942(-)